MTNFLPEDYKVPSKSDGYLKFQQGDNRFRIMTSPILGYIWWEDDGQSRRPVRVKMNQPVPVSKVDDAKHFWAMVVYNYDSRNFQILELTQKGIQKTIKSLSNDSDWGSPLNYDIVITKTGEKMETEYEVKPKPAKPLSDEILNAYKLMSINLEALYSGQDPFSSVEQMDEFKMSQAYEEVDPELETAFLGSN